jgi:hypothetical protein
MWNELCDDQHDAHAMKTINRTFLVIVACFISFGGYALSTRMGAGAPPASVAYGTEKPHPTNVVFGD